MIPPTPLVVWTGQPMDTPDAVRLIRSAFERGVTFFDTAEVYGPFKNEEVVGEALQPIRDQVVIATKFGIDIAGTAGHDGMDSRPQHIRDVVEASLKRLRTDRIDLYLLHWRGQLPLAGTVEALTELKHEGAIRHWGVSNFDVVDLAELITVTGGGEAETDQVLYNLSHRQAEHELLPWCRDWGMPLMAYSPVDRGALVQNDIVVEIAEKHDATPAQVALAWVLRNDGVCAIPKASIPEHVRENVRALDLRLDNEDHKLLDEAFPAPRSPSPLDVY